MFVPRVLNCLEHPAANHESFVPVAGIDGILRYPERCGGMDELDVAAMGGGDDAGMGDFPSSFPCRKKDHIPLLKASGGDSFAYLTLGLRGTGQSHADARK